MMCKIKNPPKGGFFIALKRFRSDFAALDGGDGVLDGAVTQADGAQRFGAASDLVLLEVDRARQALGRDIDLGAAQDELLHDLLDLENDR